MHGSEKWKWSWSVVSDSAWTHGLQPTRLLRPWDFPGKRTGVRCHGLLHLFCLCFVVKMTTYIKYFASCPYPSVLLPEGTSPWHRRLALPLCLHKLWVQMAARGCLVLPSGLAHTGSSPLPTLLSPASWQCPGVIIKPVWQQWLVTNSSLWISHLHGLNVCFRRMSWSRVQMNWLTRKILCM